MDKAQIENNYALITGASHGIGKAIARELAGRKYNLVLVALPGQELDETIDELKSEFAVKILDLGIDLTLEDSPQEVYDFIKSKDIVLDILINNVGIGASGMFHRSDMKYNKCHAESASISFHSPCLTHLKLRYLQNISLLFSEAPLNSTGDRSIPSNSGSALLSTPAIPVIVVLI